MPKENVKHWKNRRSCLWQGRGVNHARSLRSLRYTLLPHKVIVGAVQLERSQQSAPQSSVSQVCLRLAVQNTIAAPMKKKMLICLKRASNMFGTHALLFENSVESSEVSTASQVTTKQGSLYINNHDSTLLPAKPTPASPKELTI